MKKFYFIIVLLGLIFTSCKKEPITPNPPVPPSPNDTIDTTDTSNFDTTKCSILFEMYNTTSGINLKSSVDSIVCVNQTTGNSKTWISDSITWYNSYAYGNQGNYTRIIFDKPDFDGIKFTIYFKNNEIKNCWSVWNFTQEDIGSNWDIATSFSAPIPSEPTRSYFENIMY